MAAQPYTNEREIVSLTLNKADFEAMVRVMLWGTKPKRIRERLEWFYRLQGVTRPEDRETPSNVVSLGTRRAIRDCERFRGPVVTAVVLESVRQQKAAMTAIALRLEAEAASLERIARRKARKARK